MTGEVYVATELIVTMEMRDRHARLKNPVRVMGEELESRNGGEAELGEISEQPSLEDFIRKNLVKQV